MIFFRVTTLEKYQHYRERSPPWVKLYQSFLDDYELTMLGDAGRFHFAAIILLASRSGNRLPWDAEWLKSKMTADLAPDLQRLEQFGLIQRLEQDASKPLATCSATNETVLERAEGEREKRERREEKKTPSSEPSGFGEFWAAYPRKVAKAEALKAWKQVRPNGHLPAILAAIETQKQSRDWLKDGGQYIPHPATWLRQGRWEDEPDHTGATSGSSTYDALEDWSVPS